MPDDTDIKLQLSHINDELKHIKKDLDLITKSMADLIKSMKQDYVTKTEFTPVKNLVYGMVGAILLSFILGVTTLLIQSNKVTGHEGKKVVPTVPEIVGR